MGAPSGNGADPVMDAFLPGEISPAGYFVPVHRVDSAWVEHAPFAATIVDVVRPSLLVELGAHRGYSYFAFCEAAKRLGIPVSAVAVDSWEGDEHAGFYDDSVYRSVSDINERDYAHFSTLSQKYFDEAIADFADGSIDVLHIDGRHRYEDVRHEFDAWLPKMSDRGVMLFHDTNEFRTGFGVHRFWAEVEGSYPSFQFLHAHGLGVLGVGRAQTERMRRFFEAASADPSGVRDGYEDLGRAVRSLMDLERSSGKASKLEERLERVEKKSRETTRALEAERRRSDGRRRRVRDLERAIDDIRQSTSWKVSAPVRAVGALFDRRGRRSKSR